MSVLAAKSPEFRRPATVHRTNSNVKTAGSNGYSSLPTCTLSTSRVEDWSSKTLKHQAVDAMRLKSAKQFNGFVTPNGKISAAVTVAVQRDDQNRFCKVGSPKSDIKSLFV